MLLCQLGAKFTTSISSPIIFISIGTILLDKTMTLEHADKIWSITQYLGAYEGNHSDDEFCATFNSRVKQGVLGGKLICIWKLVLTIKVFHEHHCLKTWHFTKLDVPWLEKEKCCSLTSHTIRL